MEKLFKEIRIAAGSTGVDQHWFTRKETTQATQMVFNHKQAEIDQLMLEFCPERMTDEQLEAWEAAQAPVSDEMYNDVCRSLGFPTK